MVKTHTRVPHPTANHPPPNHAHTNTRHSHNQPPGVHPVTLQQPNPPPLKRPTPGKWYPPGQPGAAGEWSRSRRAA